MLTSCRQLFTFHRASLRFRVQSDRRHQFHSTSLWQSLLDQNGAGGARFFEHLVNSHGRNVRPSSLFECQTPTAVFSLGVILLGTLRHSVRVIICKNISTCAVTHYGLNAFKCGIAYRYARCVVDATQQCLKSNERASHRFINHAGENADHPRRRLARAILYLTV